MWLDPMYRGVGICSIDEWTPNWALPPLKIKREIVETPSWLCQGDLLPSSSHCRAVFRWSMKYFFLNMQPKGGQDGFWVNLSPSQLSTNKAYLPQGRQFLKNKQVDHKRFLFVATPGGLGGPWNPPTWGERQSQGCAQPFSLALGDWAESFGLGLCDEEVRLGTEKAHFCCLLFVRFLSVGYLDSFSSVSYSQTVVAMSDLNIVFCLVPTHICIFVLKRNYPWSLQKWSLKSTLHMRRLKILFSLYHWVFCSN